MMLARTLSRTPVPRLSARFCSGVSTYDFETLKVTAPAENVLEVQLNRPDKSNAMNRAFWREIAECFDKIDSDDDCRVVLLTGAGKNFTAGLDLADHMDVFTPSEDDDTARVAHRLRKFIKAYQRSFTAIEDCSKPVISAIHSACVGGGVDMVCATDVRFCSSDAWFSIKEVEIGLAADVGTLQRMPKIVGNDSLVRELALTGRRMTSEEAKAAGFVSAILPDRAALMSHALETAVVIAGHSPVAVVGTKHNLNYARDHSVGDGLEYMTAWNMSMLQTEDMVKAATAGMTKTKPSFSKL